MKVLNGSDLASYIKERQAKTVRNLRQEYGVAPKLAIVQCKDDPVINTYVRLKKQYGADIFVEVDAHFVSQTEIPELLKTLNADKNVHGIITQLPLEDPSQTDEIINLVAPEKDVDALGDPDAPWPPHSDVMQGVGEKQTEPYTKYGEGVSKPTTPQNAETSGRVPGYGGQQARGVRGSWFDPATPMAILWLLSGYNIELKGKKVLLVGRGKLVGAPLEQIFLKSEIDVTVADRSTTNLKELTLDADVIITATGRPAILYPDMIKVGAVVVDAGVASEDGKTVGDLDPSVYDRTDLTITPQKGGVGPLTVCSLFENVIRAARSQISE